MDHLNITLDLQFLKLSCFRCWKNLGSDLCGKYCYLSEFHYFGWYCLEQRLHLFCRLYKWNSDLICFTVNYRLLSATNLLVSSSSLHSDFQWSCSALLQRRYWHSLWRCRQSLLNRDHHRNWSYQSREYQGAHQSSGQLCCHYTVLMNTWCCSSAQSSSFACSMNFL